MTRQELKNRISKITKTIGTIVSNGLFSMAVALLFAVYNGYLGLSRGYGFGCSIAVYFVLLAVTMAVLYRPKRQKIDTSCDFRRSYGRRCLSAAWLLLVENLMLVAPITLIVLQQRDFNLGLIAAITVAAYTTYKMTMAIVHYVKTRRQNDVATVTFRAVKLVDALVSVLTLQNTLIIANGSAGESDMFTLSIWTSAGLYCLIVAVSVVCLVRNVRAMRAFDSEVPQCETQGVAGKNKLA